MSGEKDAEKVEEITGDLPSEEKINCVSGIFARSSPVIRLEGRRKIVDLPYWYSEKKVTPLVMLRPISQK